MTIEINEFWKLLSKSQLLPQQKTQSLFNEFSSGKHDRSASGLAKWLVDQNAISTYQATILLAGHNGPFQYGNYNLVDRFNKGHLGRTFRAVHNRTQCPVLLEFFAGTSADDLKNWRQTEALVEKASQIEHPNLLSIFESVSLPHHRFVVSQFPKGVSLLQTLSPKGRLPWKTACQLMAQVARGLQQLHDSDIIHGAVAPGCIWLQKSGFAQLRLSLPSVHHSEADDAADQKLDADLDYRPPEWSADSLPSTAGDLFALGCTLLRAIAGRTALDKTTRDEGKLKEDRKLPRNSLTANLEKFELPTELESLLQQLLAADPAQRPKELNQLSDRLAQFSDNPKLIDSFSVSRPPSMAAYRQSLNQFQPGSKLLVEQVPVIETAGVTQTFADIVSDVALKNLSVERAEKINAAAAAAQRRRKNRWRLPASVAGSLLLFASAIAVWAINADRQVVQAPVVPAVTENSLPENNSPVAIDPTPATIDLAAMPPAERPVLLQELIAEDTESLWETPTTGAPVDFSGVPLAPKIIFVFRPAEFASQPEGLRTLQSLGPEFNSLADRWQTQSGMELGEVSQLIVSLHTTPDFEYEPFFVVTTSQPREFDELLQLWNRPAQTTTENGQQLFAATNSQQAFYLFPSGDADRSLTGSDQIPAPISRFAFGSRPAIEEVANNLGASPLTGSLKKIADWTDHDRHLNVLFLRNALFNDEGQQLMGPRLQTVNRELAIMLPESVRGGLFSLHLDQGTYLELMFDRSVDIQPEDLISLLTKRLRIQRDQLTQFVGRIPPSPYWDKVRLKYDNMLADLFRNLRWDVEHGEVATNCWLPPMAAHNLIAASELVISFSSGNAGTTSPTVTTGPQTFEELLAIERDLTIANPPDLNVLMAEIEADVNDDYRDLPFRFRIRLLGSDLEQQGITKNQRPGELKINQTPLADILTAIMVGANPAKDITGPADPNCQLIWVIAEDPESPGEMAVLITTRTAAKEKSYKLPAAFEKK